MKKVYIVNGIQRSGIHAVANWLKNNLQAPYNYVNSIFVSHINDVYDYATHEVNLLILESTPLSPISFRNYKNDEYEIFLINLLRNPINHWPSYFTNAGTKDIRCNFVPLWINQHNVMKMQFLNITSVNVLFHLWFNNKGYRNYICHQLNVNNNDCGLNAIDSSGGGSSFDGLTFNGNAQRMKVLQRWKTFQWTEESLHVLKKLRPLIEYTFGPIPKEIL